MNDALNSKNAADHPDELDTTPPNPASSEAAKIAESPSSAARWEMPPPVFKRTSGRLPSSFEKTLLQGGNIPPAASDGTMPATPEVPTAQPGKGISTETSSIIVEPQPELADVIIPDEMEPSEAPGQAKRSGSMGLILTLLGLAAVLGILALILALLYIIFLRPDVSGSLF